MKSKLLYINDDLATYKSSLKLIVDKFKYKKVSKDESIMMRRYYQEFIPKWLYDYDGPVYTKYGHVLTKEMTGLVIGDYGAYIEFENPGQHFVIPEDQLWRLSPKYENCKYIHYNCKKIDDIKIYKQKGKVNYADYKIDMYYVSVADIKIPSQYIKEKYEQ